MRLPLLVAALCGLLGLWAPSAAHAQGGDDVRVLLINGGANPRVNYLSHLHHIQDMTQALVERGVPPEAITVFSADGLDKGKDLATRQEAKDLKHQWLAQGTWVGELLLPTTELKNTEWGKTKARPATHAALRQWFLQEGAKLGPQQTLLIFATDHGTKGEHDPNNGNLELWNESMTVLEFRALLAHVPPSTRVVWLMSQCFSGTFLQAMYPLGTTEPSPNMCGFTATQRDRFAYGCYPEGRGKEKVGHAFLFIDALRQQPSLNRAHEQVVQRDDSPDVPLRTSDLYLHDLVARDAAQRGQTPEQRADELLAALAQSPERLLMPEEATLLRALSDWSGLPIPASLAELDLLGAELTEALDDSEATSDQWRDHYKDHKEALWKLYLDSDEGQRRWQRKLTPDHVEDLDPDDKSKLLAAALLDLKPHIERLGAWDPLTNLRSKANQAGELRYRVQKRDAALLRMRALLFRQAGLALLRLPTAWSLPAADKPKAQASLDALTRCETFAPGAPRATSSAPVPKPLSPWSEDRDLLATLSPSWLGVAYKLLDPNEAQAAHVQLGAARVDEVQPSSPAQTAGLQRGDLLLGANGDLFGPASPLRTWAMTAPRDKAQTLRVLRDGQTLDLKLTLAPFPKKPKKE